MNRQRRLETVVGERTRVRRHRHVNIVAVRRLARQSIGQRIDISDDRVRAAHKRPVVQPPLALRVLENGFRVESADEVDIARARFRVGVGLIFCDDVVDGPVLDFAQAGDDAAGAVFALVAVDEERVAGGVHYDEEGFAEGVPGGFHLAVFVWRDVDSVAGDVLAADPVAVSFGWLRVDQAARRRSALICIELMKADLQHIANAKQLEKVQVAILRVSAPVQLALLHGAVVGWRNQRSESEGTYRYAQGWCSGARLRRRRWSRLGLG